MEFKDMKIIHKVGDDITLLHSLMNGNIVTETLAWRLDYKGKKYGSAIAGTNVKPIADEDVILLMQYMIASMIKIKKENDNERERYKSSYRYTV